MADNYRTVFVVNPAGGAGKVGRRWPDIAIALRRQFGDFEDLHTTGPGDATRLARLALRDGAEMVVAVGGDGTINEVANGFFDEGGEVVDADGVLGVLPMGTGGDFRKTLGLGKDVQENAGRLKGRHSRPLDVGRAVVTTADGGQRTQHFVNIASFGSSGEIVERANTSSKLLGGRISFFLATVRELATYDNVRVSLSCDDGEPEQRVVNVVAVCNGRYFGGGMEMGPMARLDDGQLEVVAVGDISLGFFIRYQGLLNRGEHIGRPEITHWSVKKVYAEPAKNRTVRIDLDGESGGQLPATFEVIPGAIRVHAHRA